MSKYALVTGGSRGIGRAICVRLAQEGYQVIINYASNEAEAKKTLEMMEGKGELLPFDVSNAEQTKTALSDWQKCHSEDYIEVIVNNAGIRRDNVMALMPEGDWHRVVDITLSGFFNVTQPLLPQTNYSAAKGGIIAATKALAQEVARRGITVNAVAPGFIKTDMTEGLDERELKKMIPANRFGTPEEVADLVAFLISPNAGYITGNVVSINGGMYT